jgi:hypothetical protein
MLMMLFFLSSPDETQTIVSPQKTQPQLSKTTLSEEKMHRVVFQLVVHGQLTIECQRFDSRETKERLLD